MLPRNRGTLSFFPGDELSERAGLMQSEAGYLLGESLISRLGIYFCLNSHLKGFSMVLPKIYQYEY